jgi:hypothetical protein
MSTKTKKRKSPLVETALQDLPVDGEINVAVPADDKERGTPKTIEELERQEAIFKKGHRGAIEALEKIRKHELWKLVMPSNAKFDDYMLERLGKTRQWLTQETNWLRVCRLIEAKTGKDAFQMQKVAALKFVKLINHPEALVQAYLRALRHDEVIPGTKGQIKGETAEKMVREMQDFIDLRDAWEYLDEPLQYKDYLALMYLQTEDSDGEEHKWPRAKEAFIAHAKQTKTLPSRYAIAKRFSCDELRDIVRTLLPIQREVKAMQAAQGDIADLDTDIAKVMNEELPKPKTEVRTNWLEISGDKDRMRAATMAILEQYWLDQVVKHIDKKPNIFAEFCTVRNALENKSMTPDEWAAVASATSESKASAGGRAG